MLRIEHQRGERRAVEPGANPGIFGSGGEVHFEAANREEVYGWISRTLCGQEYWKQSKAAKGLLRPYVQKMTGLNRSQVTRLIAGYIATGTGKERSYRRNRFANHYSATDVVWLAEVDEAHETLSGPATRKILQREFEHYGDSHYERLAGISAAPIYNLRKSRRYCEKRLRYEKTRPVPIAIGERRRPDPKGRPGYLRVDTVHQGDLDGVKGVYHINAVDEVTQWQVVGASAQIGEKWLMPVLEAKLLAEQTKSRPRHSNDNGLVEAKNGAVIRKHIGYGYIASGHAEAITTFYQEHFNPYLNFHRPCGVPETITDKKGKQRRLYSRYGTPWELLQDVPEFAAYLKPRTTKEDLERLADARSDTHAARAMQEAKQKLFAGLRQKRSA